MGLGLVLGFIVSFLVLALLGPLGIIELVLFTLLLGTAFGLLLRPTVRRRLAPKHGGQNA